MNDKWLIYCEESGDKGIPWIIGSSHFYIVTAILVREEDEEQLRKVIELYKYKVLRMNAPLEWKKLKTSTKKDDKLLARFFKKVSTNGPDFLVSQVICNKHETYGPGLVDRYKFMNYLYGLMFKRISWFLKATDSYAKLNIDRNTDKIAQDSLRKYISDVSTYQTGQHPRHSKPKWMNPEDHPILGFSDFLSGVTLRSLTDYYQHVNPTCKVCKRDFCIYSCGVSNFSYGKSFKYVVDWCQADLPNWDWNGLLYHPFTYKDNYKNLILPK